MRQYEQKLQRKVAQDQHAGFTAFWRQCSLSQELSGTTMQACMSRCAQRHNITMCKVNFTSRSISGHCAKGTMKSFSMLPKKHF